MKQDLRELGFRQIPHYCTHAIEFMHEIAGLLPERTGIPADLELLLASLMQESVKFLLPDNGYLFADHDYKPAMFDLLRLPFPVCALEFTATKELHAVDSGLMHAAKRIALCFDPWLLPKQQLGYLDRLCGRSFLASVPKQCLAIMGVYEANGTWGAAVGVVLVDLERDKPLVLKGLNPGDIGDITQRVETRLGQVGKTAHGLPVTFLTFPFRARVSGQTADEAVECLYIDTIDEVRVVYEFLAAINCANVGTQEIAAPRLLNDRRRKKGKPLFYPYKVLDLSPSSVGSGEPGVGGHASPRTHLRRGHLRHLGERFGYKTLWINATMVNAARGDAPAQVYRVRT